MKVESRYEIIESKIDKSFNVISRNNNTLMSESRWVQREPDSAIVYLSSEVGCNKSCRFCWLTQTGQVDDAPLTPWSVIDQARSVLAHAEAKNHWSLKHIKRLHFNFMARGEFFSNYEFWNSSETIFPQLHHVARSYIPKVSCKFKISTIFPTDMECLDGRLSDSENASALYEFVSERMGHDGCTPGDTYQIYYSLYSLRPEFRKRWIPKAIDPEIVGMAFSGTTDLLVIHHALIAGENDTEEDIALIHDWLERHNLRVQFNLVMYNPFGDKHGEGTSDVATAAYVNQMKLSHRVEMMQVIPRVGPDVYASCGMFVS